MNLTTKRFDKIFKENFGSGGSKHTSNCDFNYQVNILSKESRYSELIYVIQVYRNNELWKTFWINKNEIDARILDNFNSLSERERYSRTQKNLHRFSTVEEFELKIKELQQTIFNY